MSLVADYGDSSASDGESSKSESDSSENTNSSIELEKSVNISSAEKLPTPAFIGTSNTITELPKTSVFANPFKEAENAKQAILEKHVKMVSTQDNVRIINGRKVCWNYRKGRCRFGHNCIYAHDSDIQKSKEQLEAENQIQQTILYQSRHHSKSADLELKETDDAKDNKRKKRPGLTQGLVPGKKVMKAYHEQHNKLIPNANKK